MSRDLLPSVLLGPRPVHGSTLRGVRVGILTKDGRIGANSNRPDETVNELANGLPFSATTPIKNCRLVVIPWDRRNDDRARKQSAKAVQMSVITRTGEDFHPNRIADRNFAFEQRLDSIAGSGARVSKELDPRGRICQTESPESR